MSEDINHNYEVFRDCLSAAIIDKLSVRAPKQQKTRPSKRRKQSQNLSTSTPARDSQDSNSSSNDPADLAEFVEVFP